ncbi:thioredoxin-disulfide reductase [Candidatus Shapirobacteria bacterium]|nr:thioredoxin-disulfide reductase [Candidatus Shapirobacteria bacterium]
MDKNIYDTIIVGSGPAGLTAAIYNVRADLKTIVLAGNQPGGQLTMTTTVDNWPGFQTGIGGVKLMMDMQKQVQNLGVEIKQGLVKLIKSTPTPSFDKEGRFAVELEDGSTLHTKAVILATGARAKWLGLPSEVELVGKGVSGCATCDGFFFRNKVVVVVGGGDTACEDAVFLAKFASKVYLIHRRDSFRASAIEQKKVFENEKIEVVWNSEIKELNPSATASPMAPPFDKGDSDKLRAVKVLNNKTGEEKVMEVDGLFVAIGHNPATEFVKDLVKLDEESCIVTGENNQYPFMTSCEGVFAAGDATTSNKNYKQAISAAGDGCKAGLDAEKWLGNQK